MDGIAAGDNSVLEGELTPKEVGGFRILRRLASGATSDVLLARAEGPHGFQRVVALKILLARTKTSQDFERNFAAEASSYARLSHPAVIKLYDFFSADGQLVMVLEYVDGLPLHKLRAMLAISGERVEDKAALFLGLRVFSALAAAHGARDPARGEFSPVVHYDVNPSNIIVPWDGHVKLGDFGIARAAGAQSDPRSGFIKGTYGYLAPEQVSGKDITVRADVYSAGMILWELLARRKAVQRGTLNDAEVLKSMEHPEFPALELLRPDLDATVRVAIRRALEPDPEKRSITAEEMVTILRGAVLAEEGRKSLAAALTRVRAAGPSDPLAATTAGPAQTATSAESHGATASSAAEEERLDPEQTAPFEAITEEQGDLGKIAFYGRINLPAETVGPRSPPPAAAAPIGPALPQPPTPVMLVPQARPERGLPNVPGVPPAPGDRPLFAGPTRVTVRAIPRPDRDTKVSGYPSAPAPALDLERSPEQEPAAMDGATRGGSNLAAVATRPMHALEAVILGEPEAAPSVRPKADTPPAVVEATNPLAADSADVEASVRVALEREPPARLELSPEASAREDEAPPAPEPAAAPSTERSPEAPSVPPSSQVVDMVGGAVVAVHDPVRPNVPPYALSSLPPEAKRRGFPWPFLLLVGVTFAGAGGLWLFNSDIPAEPSAAPTRAAPQRAAKAVAAPMASSAGPTLPIVPATSTDASAVLSPSRAGATQTPTTGTPTPSTTPTGALTAGSTPPPIGGVTTTPSPTLVPSPAEPADSGELDLPASAVGHRIYVDDKVAGEGSAPIHVRCGSHVVRIGSAGVERTVKVPCGGSFNLSL